VVEGVRLIWTHVGHRGVKTRFSSGRHKWMTPYQYNHRLGLK